MLRAVLDTNVLVSAVISDGKPRQLLRKGIENRFTIVTSDLILKELAQVLRRPKFETERDEINRIVLTLMQSADVVSVESNFKVVSRDRKDDAIINAAYDARADIIVTGDHHLLELASFRGIRIVTVEAMLSLL